MEGDSIDLKTDIQKKQDESMLWYSEDTRIALINKDRSTSCTYDGEGGRFKDRLDVDYETGYLSITDARFEDSGFFEAEIIRSTDSGKSKPLNRSSAKCDSAKIIKKTNNLGETIKTISVDVRAKTEEESYKIEKEKTKTKEESHTVEKILGIGGCVLLVAVVAVLGVIYCRRRISRNVTENKKSGCLLEDQKKDDSDVSYENPSNV